MKVLESYAQVWQLWIDANKWYVSVLDNKDFQYYDYGPYSYEDAMNFARSRDHQWESK